MVASNFEAVLLLGTGSQVVIKVSEETSNFLWYAFLRTL